ncbi:CDP-diacylglycerol-serine O-phosphatidyltransferase [Tulasnella sp. 403]|nr:CDP-diacylglycerol-serine O-phosphatidyltransferase [Tulasnella sp. 403]
MSTTPARKRTKSPAKKDVTHPVASEAKAAALHQYQNDDGHFSLVRNFRLADLVTISNGICGSYSIFSSARYLLTNDKDYLWLAHAFPLAGLMFDFFDGKVARWRNSSSMLGQELDSLADLISFGVAPALLAFSIGLRTPLDTFILTCFICCGLARLARFNATAALRTGKTSFFEGLPIPSSLALVGTMAYWTKQGWIDGNAVGGSSRIPLGIISLPPSQLSFLGGESGSWGEVHTVSLIFGVWAAMMVSKTLRVPKL